MDNDRLEKIRATRRRAGATILDPAAEYPQYNKGRGYYAVFFADADGLKRWPVRGFLTRAYSPRLTPLDIALTASAQDPTCARNETECP